MAGSSTAGRKKPGPQPRGPYSDKRKTLTTRITEETRTRLDEAAEASGRSLAQEVELRLDRSFQRDDADDRVREVVWADVRNMFGGKRKFVLMRLMSGLIQSIEMVGRGSWETDPKVNKSVIIHCQAFFKLFGPGGDEGARKRGGDSLYGAIAIEEDDDAVGLEEESHLDLESLLLVMEQAKLLIKKRAGEGELL